MGQAIMSGLYKPSLMPNGVTLRAMEQADEVIFRRLYAQVRMPELAVTNWPAEEKQAFCDSQYTLQDLHYRKFYADFEPWAICRDGTVIGRLYLATFDDDLVLMDITIEAAHRGLGIGSRIVADVICEADQNRREMSLHVEPDNPARGLYARLGFVKAGEGDIYLEMRRSAAKIAPDR
jgi:ribosomal protein S18 acetylase RimI-like enzyme